MKPRFLLLHPGDPCAGDWGRVLALKPHMVYLYTLLRQAYDVTVLDLEVELGRAPTAEALAVYKQQAVELVLAVDADIVGISCWSSLSYVATRHVAEALRRARPATKIVVGGYHPTLVPSDFDYEGSPFDTVVNGEVKAFLEELGVEGDPLAVNPDYTGYPYYDSGQQAAGLYLSIGCPYVCSFCMEYDRGWRAKPPAEAVAQMKALANDFGYLMVFDPVFGLNRAWRKEFLRLLVAAEPGCQLWFETRVDLFDDDDLEQLGRLGAKVDLGVDAFSTEMLTIMGKSKHPENYLERFVEISERCSELGILHDGFLIFNHPGETTSTFDAGLQFIEKTLEPRASGGLLRLRGQSYAHFPGSPAALHPKRYLEAYGTQILVPDWWRREGDQTAMSRYVIASTDDNGVPFILDIERIEAALEGFNDRSLEYDRWKVLTAFGE